RLAWAVPEPVTGEWPPRHAQGGRLWRRRRTAPRGSRSAGIGRLFARPFGNLHGHLAQLAVAPDLDLGRGTRGHRGNHRKQRGVGLDGSTTHGQDDVTRLDSRLFGRLAREIGRASCRERTWSGLTAGSVVST